MNGILSKKTFFSVFVFLAFPFFLHAESIELNFSPSYLSEGDLVSVVLSSFDVDINNSEISWYKDGKFDKKGTGLKSYNFPISENGNTIKVSVKRGGSVLEQSIKISTSSMDVLWEVVGGYEPPFYRGKVMPIKNSRIKVVAIPQIKNEKGFVTDSGSFVYAWRKDGSNFPGQSGYGLNSFLYSSQILDRENTVNVTASGLSKSLSKNIVVTPASSEIDFYEYDLVYGPLYNRALKEGQNINTRKISILAEPYFIFTDNIDNPSFFTEWRLNSYINKPINKQLMLINVAENINRVDVQIKTDNTSELLQSMTRKIRLNIVEN